MTKIKIDGKDRLILHALEDGGRSQIKTVSKKTRIPPDSVKYRLNKLLSNGIIKGFVPICDTNKLGYPVYTWVNIILQQFDEGTEKKFEAYLREVPNIIYIAKITGAYHYTFTISTKTIQDLDRILKEIFGKFPGLIKEYNTSLMIREVQYDTFYRLLPEK